MSTQPLSSSRVYHLIVRRQADSDPIADLIADEAVERTRPSIEKVGGTIHAAHTFQVDHSYVVVELPDSVDIETVLPGYEVKAVTEDA